MPDVETRQLDIALSDIKRAGFEEDVEVVGGGTFGVVDESAWTVCKQEPAVGTTIGSAPRLIVDRSCDDPGSEKAAEEGEPQDDNNTAGTNKKADVKPKGPKPAPVETFTMPALVGANLQDAQDMLQALGSYLMTQTDATGMERFQVLDSGWKVCGQRPRAGAVVSVDKMVELFVVKLHEAC
jgi:beta-lactam-binding protein with PASTA domain